MYNKISIRISSSCNLNCSYCNIVKHDTIMSACVNNAVAKFIVKNEIKSISFSGGEPLLNIDKINNIVNKNECAIHIVTNGTILSDTIKSFFIKNHKRTNLTISIDGNEVVHNTNRSNSFSRIIKNLDFFKPYVTNINLVVTSETIFNLRNSIDFIKSLGFKKVSILIDFNSNWNSLDLVKFTSYYNFNLTNLPELDDLSTLWHFGTCDCSKNIFVNEIGDLYLCSNFDTPDNKIGDVFSGVNLDKLRPYSLCNKNTSVFNCVLENKEKYGSIFISKGKKDIHFFKTLISLIDGKVNT